MNFLTRPAAEEDLGVRGNRVASLMKKQKRLLFNFKYILCFVVCSSFMAGQASEIPIISVIPFDYDLPRELENEISIKDLSDFIRGEISFSKKAKLVNRDKENFNLGKEEYRFGVKSDSIAREIGLKNGATHIITWDIRTSETRYHIDLKHYNVSRTRGSIPLFKWLGGTIRFRYSVNKNYEELKRSIKKSTWLLLGTTPPKDRFPKDSFLVILWNSFMVFIYSTLFWIELFYGPAYVIFFLFMISSLGGYCVYTTVTAGGGEESIGIGFPPDYPEGN